MEANIIDTDEKPPCRVINCAGASFRRNRLIRSLATRQKIDKRLLLFKEPVVNVVANENRQNIHSQRP